MAHIARNASESGSPLVTFALLAYNQERFISEAVHGALAQEYSPLEIILSDDCSTDSTFEIIKSLAEQYKGPHQVHINRNSRNMGLASHFNHVWEQAQGVFILGAAGDDISLPSRVEMSVRIFLEQPDAAVVTFRHRTIDDQGQKLRSANPRKGGTGLTRVILQDYLNNCFIQGNGASRAFRKAVFDRFGPLSDTCPTEDTPMLLRGLMVGHAYFSSEDAIYYRRHDGNLSGSKSLPLLSVEEIYRQYMSDIRAARKSSIISTEMMQKLETWAGRNRQRRYLKNGFSQSERKMAYFASQMALSPVLTYKEKLVCLRDAVTSKEKL